MAAPFELTAEIAPGAGPFDEIGEGWLTLTGEAGDNASTPDDVSLDITGDIDVRVEATAEWHRLQGEVGVQSLAGKFNPATSEMSWMFYINNGQLAFAWSTDGTPSGLLARGAVDENVQGLAPPLSWGRIGLRATLDVDDGSGNNVLSFWTAPNLDGPWTLFGEENIAAGTTSIHAGAADVEIGVAHPGGSGITPIVPLPAQVWRMELRDGIDGTVAADPDFRGLAAGTASFTDDAGLDWTVNNDAEIAHFDWTEIPNKLLGASWGYGRADELEHHPAGEANLTFANDDRELDPDHAGSGFAGGLLPRTPLRLRSRWSAYEIAGGQDASTPDPWTPGADMDIRAHVAMDDWTPGAFGSALLSQMPGGGDNAFLLSVNPAGTLLFRITTDGSTNLDHTSTAATGFTDSTDHWVRVTLDGDNGAAGRDVTFYTSDDGVEWTQLGNVVTVAGTVTVHDSAGEVAIGRTLALAGQVRQVELRSSIDGPIVANPDFMSQRPGTVSFRDGTGNTWTINGGSIAIDPVHVLDELYGFVNDDGFQQDLQPPASLVARVGLVDLVGVLGAGYSLPDVFDHAVTGRSPAGYWVLDSPTAAERIPDLGSGGNDGTVIGGTQFGQTPIREGHTDSAFFSGQSDDGPEAVDRIDFGRSLILPHDRGSSLLPEGSVMATFATTHTPTISQTLFIQGDGNGEPTNLSAGKGIVLHVANDGTIRFRADRLTTAQRVGPQVVDGRGHIVFGQRAGIALDTGVLTNTAGDQIRTQTNGVGIGGHTDVDPSRHWRGRIGAVAVWGRAIAGQDRSIIFAAYTKLDGETSGTHIGWALDRLHVPLSQRNLDDGTVIMGPASTADADALEWMRDVTATEQSELRINHRDAGIVRFTNRYSRHLDTRSTTVQETFSDDPTTSNVLRVEKPDLVRDPSAAKGIINQVTVTWLGGEETVTDQDSVDRFGPRSRQVDTQATTATQARSVGGWLLTRYSQPRSRTRQIGVDASAASLGLRAVRHLQIGDRISHRLHPNQVGSADQADLFVEGVSHQVAGVEWHTQWSLSPTDTFEPWRWGISEWGVDTLWG